MRAGAARLWAVARMTLLEALRRKAFAILIFFGAVLVSATLFFPAVNAEGRLRLTQAWSLRAASLFTAVVALFLAGFSLPTDFEQKRVYLLVTKPLSKAAVYLGRLLGYALLLAIFVGLFSIVSALFMRTVSLLGGKDFPPLVAYPRLQAAELLAHGGQTLNERGETLTATVAGGTLVWRFHNLSRRDFSGPIRVSARLIVASPVDRYRSEGSVHAMARGGGGTQELPRLSWNTNEDRDFEIPQELIGSDGRLDIALRTADADGLIAGSPDRLVLYGKSALFETAYLRGMGLILLQSLIVLTMTLTASTFCSAPLSILLGIMIYLVGSVHGYVSDGLRDIDASLQEVAQSGKRVGTAQDFDPLLLRFSRLVSGPVLRVIPDFGRFDYSAWLLKDLLVPWQELGRAAGRAAPPILALLLLGVLVMRSKDFG